MKPMLAKPKSKDIAFPVYVQPKLDGIRAVYDHESRKLFTRSGNEIESVPHILEELRQYNHSLDGELVFSSNWNRRDDQSTNKYFNISAGIARRKAANVKEDHLLLSFVVFDIVHDDLTLEHRLDVIKRLVPSEHVAFVDSVLVTNADEYSDAHSRNLIDGYEGTMIRELGSLYQQKRTSSLLKDKSMLHMVAVVKECIEGSGKYISMLGSMLVEAGGVQFNVGSGFSDAQRKMLYNDDSVGRIIKIAYQDLSTNNVPRFPVFKGFV